MEGDKNFEEDGDGKVNGERGRRRYLSEWR